MADTSQEVHEVEGSVVESADECSEANVDGPVSDETLRFFSHSQLGHFRQCVLCVGSDLGEEEVQLGVSRPEEGQEVAMVAFQGVRSAIGLGLVLYRRVLTVSAGQLSPGQLSSGSTVARVNCRRVNCRRVNCRQGQPSLYPSKSCPSPDDWQSFLRTRQLPDHPARRRASHPRLTCLLRPRLRTRVPQAGEP